MPLTSEGKGAGLREVGAKAGSCFSDEVVNWSLMFYWKCLLTLCNVSGTRLCLLGSPWGVPSAHCSATGFVQLQWVQVMTKKDGYGFKTFVYMDCFCKINIICYNAIQYNFNV